MSDYIYPPPASLPPGSVVIAYLRDSGGPNQDESIPQQERVISDYCKVYGLALVRIYAETASGRKTKNRDQFLQMVNDVMMCEDDQRPRGLILWAFSRFSRDIIDFNFYLYSLLKKGVVIHSLTEQIPEGLAGQIMLSIKAYSNADFSVQLGKQIKRAIADYVRAGYSNGALPPRGYLLVRETHGLRRNGAKRIGVKWVRDPELAPLVILAWEMRARGKSYGEITEATQGKIYSSKNSWSTHFKNESYLGIGKAGSERIPDHHEALITWEIWQAVRQVEVENKKRNSGMRNKFPSLLTGLMFCIHCGAAMVLHTSKGYRCYICGRRDRRGGFSDCPNSHRVNARKIDQLVLDIISNRILSPVFANEIIAEVQKELSDTERLDHEIGNVNNALVLTGRSITRLVRLTEDTGEIEEVKTRLVELKRQQAEQIARINGLKVERDLSGPQLTPAALALVLETYRKQIQNAIERDEVSTAKKLIAQFVHKIELGNKKAIIHYTYPVTITANESASLSAHLSKL